MQRGVVVVSSGPLGRGARGRGRWGLGDWSLLPPAVGPVITVLLLAGSGLLALVFLNRFFLP